MQNIISELKINLCNDMENVDILHTVARLSEDQHFFLQDYIKTYFRIWGHEVRQKKVSLKPYITSLHMHQTIASLEEKHTSRCLAEVAIKSKFIPRFRMIGLFMNCRYFTVLKNWSEILLFIFAMLKDTTITFPPTCLFSLHISIQSLLKHSIHVGSQQPPYY